MCRSEDCDSEGMEEVVASGKKGGKGGGGVRKDGEPEGMGEVGENKWRGYLEGVCVGSKRWYGVGWWW